MTETAEADPLLDHLHARYGLEDITVIGCGGMGVVYSAYDPILDRKVAIKRMSGGLTLNEMARDRFRGEMHVLAALRDPAIVTIHSGPRSFDGDLYYIMDFVEGQSLREHLAQRRTDDSGPSSVAEVVRLLRPVAEALNRIHATTPPVVHGDIKPGNIMLPARDRGVETILVDFGIGATPGMHTPAYVPPEILAADRKGTREPAAAVSGDNYSFTLVAFEMATLQSLHRLMDRPAWFGTRTMPVLGPAALHPDDAEAHEAITAVFARALANDPADRYPTATAFLDALDKAAGYRKPWPAAAVIALVVLIAAIAAVTGYAAYRAATDWPDGRDDIVAAFPHLLPERPDQPVTWERGRRTEPYDCFPSTWQGSEAIDCRRRDDLGITLTAVGFDSERERQQGAEPMRKLIGDNGVRTPVSVDNPSAECRIQVLSGKIGHVPYTIIFPENPRNRFLLTLKGTGPDEGWKKLPLC